ncbi:ABC transporter permease [Suipraeoptans intestinalis]|uniref:ABC transporter permease n=1 Tax=Suipraeoptans intestinalis TaxID=2606628 RepID=UPI0023F1FF88|nr:ABC transporter permease [Suipraeoptans intestinalis]MDD7770896.1 ABC transporter permease [Suipraeoptans intestinalis]MDY3122134.1 ABC transporter permease [Suipraeoptans intestinalis]
MNKRQIWNRRILVALLVSAAVVYLAGIFFWGISMDPSCYDTNYADKFISPGSKHWFGTDFVGRDMFYRCIKGLSNSLIVGILASVVSSVIALAAGIASAVFGGWVDRCVNWCVDLCMGLPHLVLLILISFMMGKGVRGVTIAVALTHWPSLTRIVRSEVMQIRSSQYVQASYRLGKSKIYVAVRHILPHVLPVYMIGLILLFPHAIMHEAAITFLGFGMPAEMPAIGVILSEAMNHITTGKWWLALFPGCMLLIAVILFDVIGENLKKLWNPGSAQE